MTLLSFLPIACIIAAVNMLGARLIHYRQRSRLTTERVTGFIGELFGSMQAIKVASANKHMLKHLQGLNDTRCNAMIKDSILTQMIDSFNVNVVNLITGMILILAGQLMLNGTFTIGNFVLFVSYANILTGCPRWIGKLLARRKQAIVSYQRLSSFISGNEEELLKHSPLFLKVETPHADYIPKKQNDHLVRLQVKELA